MGFTVVYSYINGVIVKDPAIKWSHLGNLRLSLVLSYEAQIQISIFL